MVKERILKKSALKGSDFVWSTGRSGQNTEGGQIVKIEVPMATGNQTKNLAHGIGMYMHCYGKPHIPHGKPYFTHRKATQSTKPCNLLFIDCR